VNADAPHFFNEDGFVDWNGDGGFYPVAKASTIAAYNRGELQKWIPETKCAGKVFTCDDAPQADVIMTVWDGQLNSDFCTVSVSFGGAVGDCDLGNTRAITGNVATKLGTGVEAVEVLIQGAGIEKRLTVTDDIGDYAFYGIPSDVGVEVIPSKDGDDDNGVSTLDLVLIQRHILNFAPFTSPYDMIAADINDTETVTGADVVQLRKMILGVITDYPDNTSWRFVDKAQTMDVENTFPFIEKRFAPESDLDQSGVDFVAVKIGDINSSAEVLEGRSPRHIELGFDNQPVKKGDQVAIQLYSENYTDVHGYQFTLDLDGLQLEDVQGGDIAMDNSHVAVLDKKTVTVSYASHLAQDAKEVMTLYMRATKDGNTRDMMHISSRITKAEAYVATPLLEGMKEGEQIKVVSIGLKERAVEEYALYQNEPNPFQDQTVIGWNMAEDGQATITVFDLSGRVLKRITGDYTRGEHTINLQRADLSGMSGVLYYQLEVEDFTDTKKMILID
jgi:hypothetical protein